jgi:alkylhydroperoxidase family enzyme
MARIPVIDYKTASDEVKKEYDGLVKRHGSATNMKRTLLHSIPALKAYEKWYPLSDEIEPFIGERGVTLLSFAISAETDCLLCSTFFRRILIGKGENPDRLVLDDKEQLLVDYGRQLGEDPNSVSDKLFARLKSEFTDRQIVQITAFAGLMIATNVLNSALRIDLDDYLVNFTDKTGAEK